MKKKFNEEILETKNNIDVIFKTVFAEYNIKVYLYKKIKHLTPLNMDVEYIYHVLYVRDEDIDVTELTNIANEYEKDIIMPDNIFEGAYVNVLFEEKTTNIILKVIAKDHFQQKHKSNI